MNLQFKKGEKVVYPAHGVAVIDDIQVKVISGYRAPFLRAQDSRDRKMTIMIPTENVDSVGLRRVIGKDMVDKIYRILRQRKVEVDTQTWNRRYREYTEKIKTGSPLEIAKVLRDLLVLKGDKELVLRRAQDARYRAQPAGERTLDRQGASGRENHGRAQDDLRQLDASKSDRERPGVSTLAFLF